MAQLNLTKKTQNKCPTHYRQHTLKPTTTNIPQTPKIENTITYKKKPTKNQQPRPQPTKTSNHITPPPWRATPFQITDPQLPDTFTYNREFFCPICKRKTTVSERRPRQQATHKRHNLTKHTSYNHRCHHSHTTNYNHVIIPHLTYHLQHPVKITKDNKLTQQPYKCTNNINT